jgi:phosphoribosylamine--glycine ligase
VAESINVLVIGKGGREHALAWKLGQSPRARQVYCAPGNAGTALEAENVPIEPHEIDKLARFAKKESIGLTVVGPEEPLAMGIVDAFQKAGLRAFGPSQAAAQVESSKVYAKQLMRHADVPTAEFLIFDHPEPARTYIATRNEPLVVKADGLAAGKGVFVCSSNEEALEAVERIMVREEFGRAAGRQVVVERRMDGRELSVMALIAGRSIVMLPPVQDHKRVGDGDTGPNTGGMGAFSPATADDGPLLARIEEEVFVPAVHALKRRRTPYRGLLYAGMMATAQGPRVLEFNCRFGDPETQVLMMRLRGDLLGLLESVVDDTLADFVGGGLDWDPRPAVTVVVCSEGYPGTYAKGKFISGLDAAAALPDVRVFHAGTRLDGGRCVTDGGRVLAVTALGDTLAAARDRANSASDLIKFPGAFRRHDIAAGPSAPGAVG